jgi:hypothetical protein
MFPLCEALTFSKRRLCGGDASTPVGGKRFCKAMSRSAAAWRDWIRFALRLAADRSLFLARVGSQLSSSSRARASIPAQPSATATIAGAMGASAALRRPQELATIRRRTSAVRGAAPVSSGGLHRSVTRDAILRRSSQTDEGQNGHDEADEMDTAAHGVPLNRRRSFAAAHVDADACTRSVPRFLRLGTRVAKIWRSRDACRGRPARIAAGPSPIRGGRYSTVPRIRPPGTLQEQPVSTGAAEYSRQVRAGVAQ